MWTCACTSTFLISPPAQHDEIQRLRHDVRQLMPYLSQQGIYTSLNHVASGINGPLTAGHLAAILPWVDGLEVINGTRLPSQNRTALCLAQATGKHLLGGGDSHTGRGIGLTWTEVPGARTRDEFMAGLRAGRAVAAGDHGGHRTMLSDMWRFAGNFLTEGVTHHGRASRRLARLRLHLRRRARPADHADRDDRRVRALHSRTAVQSRLAV